MFAGNIKIYVATTDYVNIKLNKIYEIVECGNNNKNLGYSRDNSGDNISSMNPYYSELTLLYWIWKNKSKNYISGLNHYHRFFIENDKIIDKNQIKKILFKNDIIIPEKLYLDGYSLKEQYELCHNKNDFILCRDILKSLSHEYIESFDKVSKEQFLYPFNMFISKQNIVNEYCSFLFPILKKLENEIDYKHYDDYQKRVFGFLSERLFTTWLDKNEKIKTKEIPVYSNKEGYLKKVY